MLLRILIILTMFLATIAVSPIYARDSKPTINIFDSACDSFSKIIAFGFRELNKMQVDEHDNIEAMSYKLKTQLHIFTKMSCHPDELRRSVKRFTFKK